MKTMTMTRTFVGIALTLVSVAGAQAATSLQAVATANVRTGPGTGYTKIGQVSAGHGYVGISLSGGWWKIYFDGRTAYTYSGNWKTVANTTGLKVTIDRLNVRSGPGTGYSIVGYVYMGQIYRWASYSGGWYKIYFGGTLRYVYGAYVTKVSLSGGTTTTTTSTSLPTNLTMTLYRQQTSYWCGPTTVQMMAKYFTGKYYYQSYLANWMGTTTSGSSASAILNGIRHFANSSYFEAYFNRTRICHNINYRKPVPISFVCRYVSYSRYSSARHISPIKGYTSGGFYINDSAWGLKWASTTEFYNATQPIGSYALKVRY